MAFLPSMDDMDVPHLSHRVFRAWTAPVVQLAQRPKETNDAAAPRGRSCRHGVTIAPILGLAETQRMPPARAGPVRSGATSAGRGRR